MNNQTDHNDDLRPGASVEGKSVDENEEDGPSHQASQHQVPDSENHDPEAPSPESSEQSSPSSEDQRPGIGIPIPTSVSDVVALFREGGLMGELIRGSVGSLAVKLGNVALKFAAGVLLARILGPEEYGVYAYAFTLITIVAIPTQLGLPNLLVRYVAQYQTQDQWGYLRGVLQRSNQAVLLLSFAAVGGVVGGAWWVYGSLQEEKALTLLWASALLPLLSLGELRSAALRGLRHVLLGLIPEKVARWALLSTFVAAAYFWSPGSVSAPAAMMFHSLAALVAFVLGAWWLYVHLPTPVKIFESRFETSEWIRVALPFLLTGGMQIMNNRLDILVVSWFWPDAEVGIYEVAVQVSMLIGLGLSATNMLVGPYLSRYYSENKTEVLQKIVSAAVTFSTVLALPPLLVLVGFGDAVLEIVFGKEYARGYAALVLLCFGQFSHVVAGSVGFLLNMTGHERITLKGVSAATVANLGLNFALTPLYGMEGAAWATLITFVLWNAILVHWAYRKLSVDPSLVGFLR